MLGMQSNAMETTGHGVFNALNCTGDELLIIDLLQQAVTWYSSTWKKQFRDISLSSGLSQVINMFDGFSEAIQSFEKRRSGKNTKLRTVVIYQKCVSFEVELMLMSKQHLLIRFKNISKQKSEVKRYLQDREQLFTTSRTISVSEMATTLAHEINQPIGTIKNLLQGIRSRIISENCEHGSIIAATDRAMEQTQFAASIITRIRDYTQARTPKKTYVNLALLLRDCISLLDWELDHQGIGCRFRLSKQLMIVADKLMLQQVFINLIRNAIDAMRNSSDAKRMLFISSEVEKTQVIIRIADCGCGLTENIENKLFQPFVSTKPTGMGVGLNICRSFIELHQGKLWLTRNKHRGCTAHVLLPILSEEG